MQYYDPVCVCARARMKTQHVVKTLLAKKQQFTLATQTVKMIFKIFAGAQQGLHRALDCPGCGLSHIYIYMYIMNNSLDFIDTFLMTFASMY